MKQTVRDNSHEAGLNQSDDNWIAAYENHVVLGGPAPGDYPEDLSDEDKQELMNARRAIDALQGAFTEDRTAAESAKTEQPQRQLGDFKILHEIGRGGMGVVYEAEQISMGRQVALKVLPFAALAHGKSLQRFRNEVRAAAALDHPHIVSVYSVGEERGIHYYSMQLVHGQTMSEFIWQTRNELSSQAHPESSDAVSDAGAGSSGNEDATVDSSVALPLSTHQDEQARLSTVANSSLGTQHYRTAARLGVQAAEALQHAHDQGVLHRDIKPGNLMLNANGELYVTDFGLARIEADAGMTMTGEILGTLRYMSPEQAQGNRAVIDHRTDIYSLGATLYELITLTPPLEGRDRQELLHKIAFEEPQQPRKLNGAVPVDLETIVLKAIAKDPTDRYATAQEMADDLHRFIEGKPVQACRISANQRLWRWSKRNPVVAALSMSVATLATLVAIVTSIGYARTNVALAQAQFQEQLAVKQRDLAEQQFRNAKSAVDRMLTTAAEKLVDVPNSDEVRHQLLVDALEFYEGFLEQKNEDPNIRYDTALANKRVGEIRRSLGDRPGAKEAYREAVKLLESLVNDFPKEGAFLYSLARSVSELGYVDISWDTEANLRAQQRHLKLMKQLVAENPAQLDHRKMVAWGHTKLGNALEVADRLPEAMLHLHQGLAEWEQLYKEHPELPVDLEKLTFIHHWLGSELRDARQLAEAEKHLSIAHDLRKKLIITNPNSRRIRRDLAHIKKHLAALYRLQGRLEESEDFNRQAMAIGEKLVEDFPLDYDNRRSLYNILNSTERLFAASDRREEANQVLKKIIIHCQAMLAVAPDDNRAVGALASVYFRLGLQQYRTDTLDEEAVANFHRTQKLHEAHLKKYPGNPLIAEALVVFLIDCPAIQFQDIPRAIQLIKSLLRVYPNDGDLWSLLGAAQHAAGEWTKAIEALDKTNTLLGKRKVLDLFPLAMSQWQLGKREKGRETYQQAIKNIPDDIYNLHPERRQLRREAAEELLGIEQ